MLEQLDEERRLEHLYVGRVPATRLVCGLCRDKIKRGELAIRRRMRPGNYYSHPHCAVWNYGAEATLLLRDREVAALVRQHAHPDLQARIAAFDRARTVSRALAVDDPQIRELLAELEQRPEDRGLYAVLGDVLQLRGDVRGELISLQLELERSPEPALLVRRDQLFAAIHPGGDPAWGIGFVRKLAISGTQPAQKILDHDSARLVRELELSIDDRVTLPRSLRKLRLSPADNPWRDRSKRTAMRLEIEQQPHLELLDLRVEWQGPLVHPKLAALHVDHHSAPELLAHAVLPALRHVKLSQFEMLDALSNAPMFEALETIDVELTAVDAADLQRFVARRNGKKLARLRIIASEVPQFAHVLLALIAHDLVLTERDEVREQIDIGDARSAQ